MSQLKLTRETGTMALADALGVDATQIIRWRRAGAPLYDAEALRFWLGSRVSARTPRLLHRLNDPAEFRRIQDQLQAIN